MELQQRCNHSSVGTSGAGAPLQQVAHTLYTPLQHMHMCVPNEIQTVSFKKLSGMMQKLMAQN